MKTVWKSVIRPNSTHGDDFVMRVPAMEGAKALSVGIQLARCCVWFEVDTDAKPADMILYSVGTGFGARPDSARFIGTIIDGPFVWHIYAEN